MPTVKKETSKSEFATVLTPVTEQKMQTYINHKTTRLSLACSKTETATHPASFALKTVWGYYCILADYLTGRTRVTRCRVLQVIARTIITAVMDSIGVRLNTASDIQQIRLR